MYLKSSIQHGFLPLIIYSGTTPPTDTDITCGHNAMLAFPQEKISHYTTAYIGVLGGGARGLIAPPLKLVKV